MPSRISDVRIRLLSLYLPLPPFHENKTVSLQPIQTLWFFLGNGAEPYPLYTLTFLNRELLVPKDIQCCLQLTQLIAQSRHLMWHVASWKHNWLLRWRNMHFRVEFAMMELLVQSKPGIWIPGLYIKISATIRHSWIKLQTQSLPFCLHNFPFALFIKSCKFQSEYLQG